MSSRGIAPVIGVVGMLAVVTVLGGVVAATVPGNVDDDSVEIVSLELDVEAENNRFIFHHNGGQTITVSELNLYISIEGDSTPNQVNLETGGGVKGFPKGGFHSSSDLWRPGEMSTFDLADNNGGDEIERGTEITVRLYLEDQFLAELSTRAR